MLDAGHVVIPINAVTGACSTANNSSTAPFGHPLITLIFPHDLLFITRITRI